MGPKRVILRWLAMLVVAFVAAGAWLPSAAAQRHTAAQRQPVAVAAARGGTISDIRIEGIQRIEPETVRSYLLLQKGDQWDMERVDRSLKALFATGLFADVKLSREGSTLVIRVVENPIINRIAFEGNSKLSDKDLNTEIQLRPRVVYTRTRVQNDVQRILVLYRRHGRFAATVEPKVIQLSENRVDLVFEITEGPSTGVRSINFVGNRQFGDGTLRGTIETKESRWYRFLSTSDTYDPDRLTYDRELLRKFYLSEGYADFRVVSAVAELTPDRDGFVITFAIEEGERYHFGKVDVDIGLKDLPRENVLPLLTVQSGDWYNSDAVEHSIAVLTDALGNRGYAFVEVKPEISRNREQRSIDLVFSVREGPQVYVDRIDISGNVRTLDKVIRREFRLVEGDAFNTNKMTRSKERIKNLGFFKKVETTNTPGSAPDRTLITVEVEEQSTGELSLGLGFSTSDGPLADVSVRERNFLGRGQDLRIGTVVSFRAQQVDLSFTEPYFLDKNIAAGIDIFEVKTSPTSNFFNFDPKALTDRVRHQFLRAGSDGAIVIGAVHGEYDKQRQYWQPHLHLAGRDLNVRTIALLRRRHYQRSPLVYRPMVVQPLRDPPPQISYLLKSYWLMRERHVRTESQKASTFRRIPEPLHSEYLMMQDQFNLLDFVFLLGVRRQGHRLVPLSAPR